MICGSPARSTEPSQKNSKTVTKPFSRSNVVIAFGKGATEEYQNFNPLHGKVQYGKLFPDSTEHPLIQNKYFLVADREVDMDGRLLHEPHSAQIYQKLSHAPVYGIAQPNKDELKKLLDSFQIPNAAILLVNLREEPVLFLSGDELSSNTVTFSIREKDKLQSFIIHGITAKHASLNEIAIRKEVLNHAAMEESSKFCFYNSLSNAQKEPHKYSILCEDFLLTSDEIYHQLQFEYQNLKCKRVCLPLYGAPTEKQFDDFIAMMKGDIYDGKSKMQMHTIFICNNGHERSTLAMVMSGLMYGHIFGFPHEVSSSPYKSNTKKPNYEFGEFNVIKMLIAQLPDGLIVKHQVDSLIDEFKDMYSLRKEIFNVKTEFDKLQIPDQYTKEGKAKRKMLRSHLETYFYLICFNAYLAEQVKHNFYLSFTSWMLQRPTLYRLQAFLDVTPQKGQDLLENSLFVLDSITCNDVLGTLPSLGGANFHRMEGLPLFGMGQPNQNGIQKLFEHMTKERKYSHVFFINLRNNLCTFIKNEAYYMSCKSESLKPRLHHPDDTHFEDIESSLSAGITQTPIMLIKDLKKEPEKIDATMVFTTKEVFQMAEEKFHNMSYFRVPLPSDYAVNENVLDDLMGMLTDAENQSRNSSQDLKHQRSSTNSGSFLLSSQKSGAEIYKRRSSNSSNMLLKGSSECAVAIAPFNPVYCFFCTNGIERSTFAMAASALFMYNKSGYPPGTRPGEQERVSIANAEYTMGKFLAVKHIVMILPDGYQVKREVDFVLDKLFEMMSTTHFHLREMILVTYNQAQKSTSQKAQKELYIQSLLLLERYIYLILFNGYLHTEKKPRRKTFRQWMEKDCKRAGVYRLLNDLAFHDFQTEIGILSTLRERWRELNKLEDGEFV